MKERSVGGSGGMNVKKKNKRVSPEPKRVSQTPAKAPVPAKTSTPVIAGVQREKQQAPNKVSALSNNHSTARAANNARTQQPQRTFRPQQTESVNVQPMSLDRTKSALPGADVAARNKAYADYAQRYMTEKHGISGLSRVAEGVDALKRYEQTGKAGPLSSTNSRSFKGEYSEYDKQFTDESFDRDEQYNAIYQKLSTGTSFQELAPDEQRYWTKCGLNAKTGALANGSLGRTSTSGSGVDYSTLNMKMGGNVGDLSGEFDQKNKAYLAYGCRNWDEETVNAFLDDMEASIAEAEKYGGGYALDEYQEAYDFVLENTKGRFKSVSDRAIAYWENAQEAIDVNRGYYKSDIYQNRHDIEQADQHYTPEDLERMELWRQWNGSTNGTDGPVLYSNLDQESNREGYGNRAQSERTRIENAMKNQEMIDKYADVVNAEPDMLEGPEGAVAGPGVLERAQAELKSIDVNNGGSSVMRLVKAVLTGDIPERAKLTRGGMDPNGEAITAGEMREFMSDAELGTMAAIYRDEGAEAAAEYFNIVCEDHLYQDKYYADQQRERDTVLGTEYHQAEVQRTQEIEESVPVDQEAVDRAAGYMQEAEARFEQLDFSGQGISRSNMPDVYDAIFLSDKVAAMAGYEVVDTEAELPWKQVLDIARKVQDADLTDEERARLYVIAGDNDDNGQAAIEYIDNLTMAKRDGGADRSFGHGVANAARFGFRSLMAPASAIEGWASAIDHATGNQSNPYAGNIASNFRTNNMSSTIEYGREIGFADAPLPDWMGGAEKGTWGDFLIQSIGSGMDSAVESAFAMYLTGGFGMPAAIANKVAQAVSLTIMAGRTFNDEYQNARRDPSQNDNQAFSGAVFKSAVEIATETFLSPEQYGFFETAQATSWNEFAKNAAKQLGSEALEEIYSDAINMAAEQIGTGTNEVDQMIDTWLHDGYQIGSREAMFCATLFGTLGLSGLGGAIGAVGGVGGSAANIGLTNAVNNMQANRDAGNMLADSEGNEASYLVRTALQQGTAKEKAAAQKILNAMDKDGVTLVDIETLKEFDELRNKFGTKPAAPVGPAMTDEQRAQQAAGTTETTESTESTETTQTTPEVVEAEAEVSEVEQEQQQEAAPEATEESTESAQTASDETKVESKEDVEAQKRADDAKARKTRQMIRKLTRQAERAVGQTKQLLIQRVGELHEQLNNLTANAAMAAKASTEAVQEAVEANADSAQTEAIQAAAETTIEEAKPAEVPVESKEDHEADVKAEEAQDRSERAKGRVAAAETDEESAQAAEDAEMRARYEELQKQIQPAVDWFKNADKKTKRNLGKLFRQVTNSLGISVDNAKKEEVQAKLKSTLGAEMEGMEETVTSALTDLIFSAENAAQESLDVLKDYVDTHKTSTVATIMSQVAAGSSNWNAAGDLYSSETKGKIATLERLFGVPYASTNAEYKPGTRSAAVMETTQKARDAGRAGIGNRVSQDGGMHVISADGHTADITSVDPTGYRVNDETGELEQRVTGTVTNADGTKEDATYWVSQRNIIGTADDATANNAIRTISNGDAGVASVLGASWAAAQAGGMDGLTWTNMVTTAYLYGRSGVSMEHTMSALEGVVGHVEDAVKAAHESGHESAKTNRNNVRRIGRQHGKKTTLRYDNGVKYDNLDDASKAAVRIMQRFADAGAVNVVITDTSNKVNAKGKFTEKNGAYVGSTNTIYVDVTAGRKGVNDGIKAFMAGTFSHELTHYIQAWNAEGYQKLVEIVSDYMASKNDTTFDDMVAAEIANIIKGNTRNLSETDIYDRAVDEVVAQACEMMLDDNTLFDQIAKEDRTLAQKILDFIKDLINDIKEAFSGMAPDTVEAQLIQENVETFEKLQKQWTKALVDAMNTAIEEHTSKVEGDGIRVSNDVAEYMESDAYESPNERDQHRTIDAWADSYKKTYGESQQFQVLLGNMKAFNDQILRSDTLRYLMPHGVNFNVDERGNLKSARGFSRQGKDYGKSDIGSLRSNVEYGITFDLDTKCERTYQYLALRGKIENMLGRRITSLEARQLIGVMRCYGYAIPCTYCYVEGKRMNLVDKYNKVLAAEGMQHTGRNVAPTDIFRAVEESRTIIDNYMNDRFGSKELHPENWKIDESTRVLNEDGTVKFEGYNDFWLPNDFNLENTVRDIMEENGLEYHEAVAKAKDRIEQRMLAKLAAMDDVESLSEDQRTELINEALEELQQEEQSIREAKIPYLAIKDQKSQQTIKKVNGETAEEAENRVTTNREIKAANAQLTADKRAAKAAYDAAVAAVEKHRAEIEKAAADYLKSHNIESLDLSETDTSTDEAEETTEAEDSAPEKTVAEAELVKTAIREYNYRNGAQTVISNTVSEWINSMSADVPFNTNYGTDDLQSDTIDGDLLSLHNRATAAAQGGVKANVVKDYKPYVDEISRITVDEKRNMNARGGIRIHSSNDFQLGNIIDYLQFFGDLAGDQRGGFGHFVHTYSKNPTFANIFSRFGARINMSIAMYTVDGKVVENKAEGMMWEMAKKLRSDPATKNNCGTMAMVTDNAQLEFAMNADWIDMIIPFHASGMPNQMFYDVMGWLNYTSIQGERMLNGTEMWEKIQQSDWYKAKTEAGEVIKKPASADMQVMYDEAMGIDEAHQLHKKGKGGKPGARYAPHFLPGSYTDEQGNEIPGWHDPANPDSDAQRYLDLCKEYGVKPRFQGLQIKEDDAHGGQVVDITEHHGYIKLIKEASRTDTEQQYISIPQDEETWNLIREQIDSFGGYESFGDDWANVAEKFVNTYAGRMGTAEDKLAGTADYTVGEYDDIDQEMFTITNKDMTDAFYEDRVERQAKLAKFLQNLENVKAKAEAEGKSVPNAIGKAKADYYAAANPIKVQQAGMEADDVRFQVRNVNGKKVVWMDRNILEDKQEGESDLDFVGRYIDENINGIVTIAGDGTPVDVGAFSDEYRFSDYTMSVMRNRRSRFNAKMRAVGYIDEIVENADNGVFEETKHNWSKDAENGMYRYDVRFAFPTYEPKKGGGVKLTNVRAYTADLLVRHASDGGKYLYDIVALKNDATQARALFDSAIREETLPQPGNINENSITNYDIDVNTENAEDVRDKARNSEGTELTPGQAEYFRESKIVDEDGNLQVIYHGTGAEFYEFDTSVHGGKTGRVEGFGIYLTDTEEVADSYGSRVIKGYANIVRPATSWQKTIKRSELIKLIKAAAERHAWEMTVKDGYDDIASALKDSWVSNYVDTYSVRNMDAAYRDVADQVLSTNDNDKDIVQEIMAGMAIRTYDAANDFYENVLTPTTGIDGFVTRWKNDQTGSYAKVVLAFNSNQVKDIDNANPTDAADIRFKDRTDPIVTDRQLAQMASDAVAETAIEREYLQKYRSALAQMTEKDALVKHYRDKMYDAKDEKTQDAYRERMIYERNLYENALKRTKELERKQPLQDVLSKIRSETEAAVYEALTIARDSGGSIDVQEALKSQQARYEKQIEELKEAAKGKQTVPADQAALIKRLQKQIDALKIAHDTQMAKELEKRKSAVARAKEGMRDRRESTELRQRIRRIIDDFNNRIAHPRPGHYVPKEMLGGLVEAMEAFDLSYVRNGEEVVPRAIQDIRAVYERYKDNSGIGLVYSPVISNLLVSLEEQLAGKKFRNLTKNDLQLVANVMTALHKTIIDANKAKAVKYSQDLHQIAKAMVDETGHAKVAIGKLGEIINEQMTPDNMFNRLGGWKKNSAWNSTQQALVEAEETKIATQREFVELFSDLTDRKEFKDLTKWHKDDLIDVGLTDIETGEAVPITKGFALALYMHLSSEDNLLGIARGGLTIPNFAKFYGGHADRAYNGIGSHRTEGVSQRLNKLKTGMIAEGVDATEMDKVLSGAREQIEEEKIGYLYQVRDAIEQYMGEYEHQLVDRAHEWFDVRQRDKLNDITMDMYGFEKATVPNYFPIHRDMNFVKHDIETVSRDINLENVGFLKERVQSSAPVMLTDFAYEMDNNLQKTSQYIGFVRALRDFNGLYNSVMGGMTTSVREQIANTLGTGKGSFGKTATAYIDKYITDLTGGEQVSQSVFAAVRRNMPRATLSLNPRVALSQLASIPTAAAELGWGAVGKGIIKGMGTAFSTAKKNEIAAKNVWFWQRYRGEGGMTEFADAKGGANVIDRAWNTAAKSKIGSKLLNWCQDMDVAATAILYRAAEEWVTDNTGYARGSEQWQQAVDDKYRETLRRTQPMYTPTERSDLMRNNNEIMKFFTMYKTQATQNLNTLYGAIAEYSQRVKDLRAGVEGVTSEDVVTSRKRLANSVTAIGVAAVTFAIMRFMVNALMGKLKKYRDDEDELTVESILGGVSEEAASSLASMVMWGDVVYDAAYAAITGDKYWGIEDSAIGQANDLLDSLVKLAQNDDPNKTWDLIHKVMSNISGSVGIPLGNVEGFVSAGDMWVRDIANGTFGTFEASVSRTAAMEYSRAIRAAIDGNGELYDELLAGVMEGENKSRKKVLGGVVSQITELYKDGAITAEEASKVLADERYGIGMSEDDLFWQLDKMEYAKQNGSTSGYSKNARMQAALETGADYEVKDTIQWYSEHGYSASQIENAIKNSLKASYLDDTFNWDQVAVKAQDYLYAGSTGDDLQNDLYWLKDELDWAKNDDAEYGQNYSKYGDLKTAMDGMNLAEVLAEIERLKSHGVKKSSLGTQISNMYKEDWIALNAVDPAKAQQMLDEMIIPAYVAAGYGEASERRYIAKHWK